MLTYATIAAGSPSDTAGMVNHLLNETLPREVADLTRYYTRGMETGADEAIARQDMDPLVAKGLGIDPDRALSREELSALLAGRRTDGEKIEGKTYSQLRTYTDPKTGEEKEKVPLGSVDFCMTPDKSVSVAWAFAGPAEQAAIYQAHRDAAHEVMLHIEQEIGRAGKGKGGKDGHDPGGIGWVAFDHYTSRPTLWIARNEDGKRITEAVPMRVAGDPDLHTHFTVMNAVFCENGRVGSLDLDRLEGLIKEGGALYQAHLATNLRKLGADAILDPDTGAARLTAIPETVRSHFSKKTVNGEEVAREYAKTQGLDWDALTPERKTGLLKSGTQGMALRGLDADTIGKLKKDDMADFADWKRQAAELNWKHDTILTRQPDGPQIEREKRLDRAYREALPWLEKDLDSRAVITWAEVRTAAARGLIASGIDSTAEIEAVTSLFRQKGVRQYGEMTTLLVAGDDGERHTKVTTGLHLAHEQEFIEKAKAAADDRSGALSRNQIKQAIRQSGLSFEGDHGRAQLNAIHRLGEGGKLGVLIGAAGAGKTTLMQPLISAWQAHGKQVYGIALAWRQADDLTDAGIHQRDVKALSVFFQAVEKEQITLDRKAVVVVDELSLLGTRQGLELVRLQEKHGFQLAMIGDDRQCQAIEAGPIIELTRKALGADQVPEILTTVRQQTEREREIAAAFRAGKAAEAFAMKREDRTVELVPGSYQEAIKRAAELVKERIQANAGDPRYTLTLSAPTNTDAHQIGMAVREARRELGQIGRDTVRIKATDRDGNGYDMALASGDKVRLFSSTRAKGQMGSIGRNGSILTVLDAKKDGMTVKSANGKEGFIPWKTLADDKGHIRLAYGEVATTHTAQGSTSTEHIYVLPQGSKAVNAFSAYSSSTRHRRSSFMLLSAGAEMAEVAQRRPLNDTRPISEQDAWANAARNLSRQPVKNMATDLIKQSVNTERGAARAMQRGFQRIEQRVKKGMAGTALHLSFQQTRENRKVRELAAILAETAKQRGQILTRMGNFGEQVKQVIEKGKPQPSRVQQSPQPSKGPRISL
ncbi:hypothetical protein SAE02_67800 [Skermanella aerolata]|uniref:TrwC relaxase domain-containing protein n=1 Tax=Skermanella aerolata TaxID=393310 RepID=A0A512E1P2_9PROT|nr:MobF family relaxase [Skermanella aerolata]GEO42632.1 hypothetical protein SAE02_67800 [Skermanella aerolata]